MNFKFDYVNFKLRLAVQKETIMLSFSRQSGSRYATQFEPGAFYYKLSKYEC